MMREEKKGEKNERAEQLLLLSRESFVTASFFLFFLSPLPRAFSLSLCLSSIASLYFLSFFESDTKNMQRT